MLNTSLCKDIFLTGLLIFMAAGALPGDAKTPRQGARYEDLIALFEDWRAFQDRKSTRLNSSH